ncbi:MAG: NADPH-dependent F420 reductase [Bdellovibrionales bacterium]
MSVKIAVLGSGVVGKTLTDGFKKHGYQVRQSSRGEFKENSAWAELIVLAVKGSVAESALQLAGAENLKGKTIIDATNPIADAPPEDGVLRFFTTLDQSLMERLQAKFPEAHLVKAFSSVGNAHMVNPNFNGIKPSMFICGNHEGSKRQVGEILSQFGWEAEDMGSAKAARAIEPLCMLWCIPGLRGNKWNHAFKLLKN